MSDSPWQRLTRLRVHSCVGRFALTKNLCYTVVGVKCYASKRGCRDRFLVSIPLGACVATYGKVDKSEGPLL